jgi:transporter family protein
LTSSVALALGAGLTFSLSHFMVRLGLDTSNPRTAVTVNVTVNALGLWALAGLFAPIRPIWSLSAWPFVVAGLFAPSLARIFLYRGYRHMGLARSSVLVGATPLFSVIVAISFLGERPSGLVLLGTLFIIIGIGTMSYTRTGGGSWSTWTIFLPLAAALCFAFRDIFTKLGLGLVPIPVSGAALTALTATLALYVSFLSSSGRERFVVNAKSLWLFIGSGVLLVAAYLLVFFALNQGDVSLVSPLVNIHPLYSVGLSYIFLQSSENVTGKVVGGGVLIVAGAIGVLLG